MQRIQFFACVLTLLLIAPRAHADSGYDPDANPSKTTSYETLWHDGARDRDVPVKIYYPTDAKDGSPVIIFSHGLGGSREGYSYLGQYWASHGYVSVHITHHGSDTEAAMANGLDQFKQTAEAIATDPMNALDRVKDVSFIIDQLTGANADEKSPLFHRMDLSRIGMAGHSYGASTTMLVCGELSHSGHTFTEDRIKCAIAMSPPVSVPKAMYDRTYAGVKIPLFVMTGTRDDSPIGESKAVDRRVPFDHVKDIPAYLIIFQDADHLLFSGKHRVKQATDDRDQQLVLQGSVAFWDAYLRGNEEAKKWLCNGAFEKQVGEAGKFEEKNAH
jgi:predicted dienelactone hydrolase